MLARSIRVAPSKPPQKAQFYHHASAHNCHTPVAQQISNRVANQHYSTSAWKQPIKHTHLPRFANTLLLQHSDFLSSAQSHTTLLPVNHLPPQNLLSHTQAVPRVRTRYVHNRPSSSESVVASASAAAPLALDVATTNIKATAATATAQTSETQKQVKEWLKVRP